MNNILYIFAKSVKCYTYLHKSVNIEILYG